MAITRAEVQHVAHLARLGLTEAEQDLMAQQLNHILEAMESLRQLDTSHIPPTAQITPVRNVMRDDVVRPAWPAHEVLMNAPRQRDQQFVVPAVLD